MNEDSPENMLCDIFQSEFYPGHPMGLAITGTPETVRTFDHQLTSRYHRSAFAPSNLVIAAAGNVDHDDLLARVQKLDFAEGEPFRGGMLTAPVTAAPIRIEHREQNR